MKAISMRQPWANMVFRSGKSVEVRNLYTNYRGPLVIHASVVQSNADFLKLGIDSALIPTYEQKCFIGIVNLVNVRKLNEIMWEELREKHLVPGRWNEFNQKYAWFFEDSYEIEPIPYRGLPSIFSVDPKITNKIIRKADN